eukprot:Ihof_evm6s263 gene=Ihof_evmTU6s263
MDSDMVKLTEKVKNVTVNADEKSKSKSIPVGRSPRTASANEKGEGWHTVSHGHSHSLKSETSAGSLKKSQSERGEGPRWIREGKDGNEEGRKGYHGRNPSYERHTGLFPQSNTLSAPHESSSPRSPKGMGRPRGGQKGHHARDHSPPATDREQAFAICRKAIVDGDHVEVLREMITSKQIENCNNFGFFGHGTSDGQTLLMVSCKYGRIKCMELLLDEFHVEVNMQGGLGHFSALHYAAWHGHVDAVTLLLEHGADCHLTNGDNETPEQSAIAHKYLNVAEVLRNWASNPNPKVPIKPVNEEEKKRAYADAAK